MEITSRRTDGSIKRIVVYFVSAESVGQTGSNDHPELPILSHPCSTLGTIGAKLLTLNYKPQHKSRDEGIVKIPNDRPVCFAMNHTDQHTAAILPVFIKSTQAIYRVVKAKYHQTICPSFLAEHQPYPWLLVIHHHNTLKRAVGRSPQP